MRATTKHEGSTDFSVEEKRHQEDTKMTKRSFKRIFAGIMAGALTAAYMAIPAAAGTVNVGSYTGNYYFYVGATSSRVDASLNLDPTYYNVTVKITAKFYWKSKNGSEIGIYTDNNGENGKDTNGLSVVGTNPQPSNYTGDFITASIYYKGAGASCTANLDSRYN